MTFQQYLDYIVLYYAKNCRHSFEALALFQTLEAKRLRRAQLGGFFAWRQESPGVTKPMEVTKRSGHEWITSMEDRNCTLNLRIVMDRNDGNEWKLMEMA